MKPSLIGFSSGGALVSDWPAPADFASPAHPAMRPAPAVPAMPRASARTTSLRFQVLLLMWSSGGGQRLCPGMQSHAVSGLVIRARTVGESFGNGGAVHGSSPEHRAPRP